jgi:hypothetical protein
VDFSRRPIGKGGAAANRGGGDSVPSETLMREPSALQPPLGLNILLGQETMEQGGWVVRFGGERRAEGLEPAPEGS